MYPFLADTGEDNPFKAKMKSTPERRYAKPIIVVFIYIYLFIFSF